jgi:chromosome partitioning protein
MGIFFNRNNNRNNSDSLDSEVNTHESEMSPQSATSKREANGKILAFLNQKGGVGKTTMAFNTAHALSERGHKVLCLDMDPQANLSLLCGIDTAELDGPTVHQLLINSVRELKPLHASALVQNVIIRGERVDLLPAGQELSGFELSVAGVSIPRQLILKKFLENNRLLEMYDYIVIDGPPTLGLLVVNIMCAAHGLLVPFRPDEFSRKGLGHFYEALDQVEEMGVSNAPHVVAHIPNLVDMRRKQEGDDLNRIQGELEEEFGTGTVMAPFFNRAPLVRSQAEKKSVFEFHSKEFLPLQNQFNDIALKINEWNEGTSW